LTRQRAKRILIRRALLRATFTPSYRPASRRLSIRAFLAGVVVGLLAHDLLLIVLVIAYHR